MLIFKTPTHIYTAWEGHCTVVLDSTAQYINQLLVLPSQALFPIKPVCIIVPSHPAMQRDWESREEVVSGKEAILWPKL